MSYFRSPLSPLICHLTVGVELILLLNNSHTSDGILTAAAARIGRRSRPQPSPSGPGASLPSSTGSQRKAWRLLRESFAGTRCWSLLVSQQRPAPPLQVAGLQWPDISAICFARTCRTRAFGFQAIRLSFWP